MSFLKEGQQGEKYTYTFTLPEKETSYGEWLGTVLSFECFFENRTPNAEGLDSSFTISELQIEEGNEATQYTYEGMSVITSPDFSVTNEGKITANEGRIGPLTLRIDPSDISRKIVVIEREEKDVIVPYFLFVDSLMTKTSQNNTRITNIYGEIGSFTYLFRRSNIQAGSSAHNVLLISNPGFNSSYNPSKPMEWFAKIYNDNSDYLNNFPTSYNGSIIISAGSYYGDIYCLHGRIAGTWESQSAISTYSDVNKKNSIQLLPETYSLIFDTLKPSLFKYNDGQSDRYHTGFIAQDIEQAVLDAGLTTKEFAAVCYNINKETGEKEDYSVRYEELIALCVNEIQKLKAEVKQLKAAAAEEIKGEEIENDSTTNV
jgi:hypothetical protein